MDFLNGTVKFSFPTSIQFGAKVRYQSRDYLRSQFLKRPLLVADRGIQPLPLYKEYMEYLRAGDLAVDEFYDFQGNPLKSHVRSGVESFKKHKADSIIGFGGGAALDMAKAIALMAYHPGDLFDYEDEKPGARPIDQEIPPWIALPTTSGTGSEIGRSTVISDDQTHVKKIMFSPRLMAKMVFADPETTLALPKDVTAATGMDALTHCVESYLAKGYHPLCDGVALEGFKLAAHSLKKAYQSPTDLNARTQMMMASMMGAVAFQKGLGLTHSCAHALSTYANFHHGLANGIMIDHALAYNVEGVSERFEWLAIAAKINRPSAESFIHWLRELKGDIGIPKSLSEARTGAGGSLSIKDIEPLSLLAFRDVCHQSNPKPCTQDTFKSIFKNALS